MSMVSQRSQAGFDFRGQPNPFQDHPIPAYALKWDEAILRPPVFPQDYDIYIHPSAIFALPHSSPSGEPTNLVIPPPCDRCHCRNLEKYICSRGNPCNYCEHESRVCTYSRPGYAVLHHGDGRRSTRSKRPAVTATASAGLRENLTNKRSVSAQATPNLKGPKSGRVRRKLRSKAPEKKKNKTLNKLSKSLNAKKRPVGRPATAPPRKVQSASTSRRKAVSSEGRNKSTASKKDRKVTSKRAKPLLAKSSIDRRLKNQQKVDTSRLKDKAGWQFVVPTRSDAVMSTDKAAPPRLPQVWASSKEELFAILPEYKEAINGIVCNDTDPPVLFVEGRCWPEDKWDGGKEIKWSTVRELHVAETEQISLGVNQASLDAACAAPSVVAGRPSSGPGQSVLPLYLHPFQSISCDASQSYHDQTFAVSLNQHHLAPGNVIPPGSPSLPSVDLHSQQNASPTFKAISTHYGCPDVEMTSFIPSSTCAGECCSSISHEQGDFDISSYELQYPDYDEYSVRDVAPPMQLFEHMPAYPLIHSFKMPQQDLATEPAQSISVEQFGTNDAMFDDTGSGVPRDQPGYGTDHFSPPSQLLPDELLKTVPREIEVLIHCSKTKMPVSIIMSRSNDLMAFTLPERYGYVFLGFFEVTDVCTVQQNCYDADCHRWRICWTFSLKWVSMGEHPDTVAVGLPASRIPWWISPVPEDAKVLNFNDGGIHDIYPLLPLNLHVANDASREEIIDSISEVVQSPGWYCMRCGKLNVQICLWYQKCSECQAVNCMPSLDAYYVRNTYKCAPVMYPEDRYVAGVQSTDSVSQTGMRYFTYDLGNGAFVKHVFTCNLAELQKEPGRLFRNIQVSVELKMRGLKTGLAAGPYYSMAVGTVADCDPQSWTDALPCVQQVRELMLNCSQLEEGESCLTIDGLVVLAWFKTGIKKDCIFSAKTSTITVLCLGADIELTIFRSAAAKVVHDSVGPTSSFIPSDIGEKAATSLPAHSSTDALESGDVFDTHDDDFDNEDLPLPEDGLIDASISMRPPVISKRMANRINKEELLLVTLVHGDMLLLEGDDFTYSLKRTGMSIVVIGTSMRTLAA